MRARPEGGAAFKRLPFNFCSVSLQPFSHPVCTLNGTIFDLTHILPWLAKHGTNPVNGQPLKSADLIKLNFAKNDEGDYVDPVTYKPFTDNSHIVALRKTGNVFAWDTVDRLNVKAKMWKDLVSDEAFTRKDIITLQDPQNLGSRDLTSFKYIKDGTSVPVAAEEQSDAVSGINSSALGNAARILKAKEAVAAARAKKDAEANSSSSALSKTSNTPSTSRTTLAPASKTPYNAAQHTTGKAAASLTSTGLTPYTGNERAILSREEYLLKPKRVKHKGYVRISTSLGDMRLELLPEWAPKAVWNFVTLAKRGYYNGLGFHRNIRSFMIQGGDPTATGRGGSSCWEAPFEDELEGPESHDARGIVSMANKGKNSNSSQFFILYRAAKHLDRKHTVFARVVEGLETLARMEAVEVSDKDKRPLVDIVMRDVTVLIDPFEEFERERETGEAEKRAQDEIRRTGGTEDDKVTWTGKRVKGLAAQGTSAAEQGGGVGRYLKRAMAEAQNGSAAKQQNEVVEDWQADHVPHEPPKKKSKGGFGSFDNW